MTNSVKTVIAATISVMALSACSVNTAPPTSPTPNVVVTPPPAVTTPGSTVVVPR